MNKLAFIITAIIFFWSCQVICADDQVNSYISRMTLKEKVGQLILIGFQGKDLKAEDIDHINKLSPGGIVFYRRNLNDASDIALLIPKINNVLDNKLPVFFAVDQEGWIVHRIGGELYTPPSAPAIGAANSEKLARDVGLSVGSALRELGININLAPVLDVLDIPAEVNNPPMTMRTFSDNFRTVEALGTAYIKGLKDSGVMATAKHFPGMGSADSDTHYQLPRIKWKQTTDREQDIRPFAGAIESGVDLIMTGHFLAEPGDSANPISLSSYWMTDVLRMKMNFKGLIIVDDIEMKPINNLMPISKAAVKAFKAGADIIMVSHGRKNQKAVFNALLNAVKKGDISIERLNETLRRIIQAKLRIAPHEIVIKPYYNLDVLSVLIAENAIVDIRSADPSSDEINRQDKVLYAGDNPSLFKAIETFFTHSELLTMPLLQYDKSNPENGIMRSIQKFDAVIINAGYPDARRLISICNDLHIKYVVVLNNPVYVLKVLNALKPKRIIITFENSTIHLKTAAEIIGSVKKAKGRLPYNFDLPVNYIYYSDNHL